MRQFLENLATIGAIGLLVGSVVMLLLGSWPAVEVVTNFRPHVLFGGFGLFIFAAVVNRSAAVIVLVAVVALLPLSLIHI